MLISLWLGLLLSFFSTASPISLSEYSHLERTTPELLFSDLDLDETHNYPHLEKLVFLTPWNKEGFSLSLKYANKLSYVSPCWYSLEVDGSGEPKFQNVHNYDPQFHKAMKRANPKTKVVPRVYVEGSQASFFKSIGNNRLHFLKTVQLIDELVKKNSFDGIVWDSPFNFFQNSRTALNELITELLVSLRGELGQEFEILFNMASPADHAASLNIDLYRKLPIDRLLIQNYDKGGRYLQLIDKAIQWKRDQRIDFPVILMLPFFSTSEGGQPLSTRDVTLLAKQHGVASNRISQGMCLIGLKNRKRFYVPCLSYFTEAWARAEAAAAGVGFWEGGNGLQNYFKFM